MSSCQYWKDSGNESYRAGRFEEAIHAYSEGLKKAPDSDTSLRSTILSNPSAAFFSLNSYQLAFSDAHDALLLMPDNIKARYRLSKTLHQLRSYQRALDELRPVASSSDSNIQSLLRLLITCVAENRHGQFDVFMIKEESKLNPRVSHADFCSEFIELSRSEIGGEGGRGIFAKKDIPQGTLLIAAKAIDCVFPDEPETSIEFIRSHTPEAPNYDITGRVMLALAHRLFLMVKSRGCGRAILNLEGGNYDKKTDINLSRDDVYSEIESVRSVGITQEVMMEIIDRNGFAVQKANSEVEGRALFYVPSFINHSCMSNTTIEICGDMMFVRSGIMIPAGTEILNNYVKSDSVDSYQDRAAFLQCRRGPFICNCQLCQFERVHSQMVLPNIKIIKKLLMKYNSPERQRSTEAVIELESARLSLYNLYGFSPPKDSLHLIYTMKEAAIFSSTTPLRFAFARLLRKVLTPLIYSLHENGRDYEAVQRTAEAFGLLKGNISGTGYDAVNCASTVWKALRESGNSLFCGPMASFWLQEFKDICSMAAGKQYFERCYSSFVQQVESHAPNPRE